jgi:hypothetical protein
LTKVPLTKDFVEFIAADHAARCGGTAVINYKKWGLCAPMNDVVDMATDLAEHTPKRRKQVMTSVNASLAKAEARMHKLSEKEHQNFCHDVVIWYANEILDGRATLDDCKQDMPTMLGKIVYE